MPTPILLSDAPVATDDEAAEEAAPAIATVDSEFGRTTDPVRMYMREMGTVELLTREGEIRIAKRIEQGLNQVKQSVAFFPPSIDVIARAYEPVKTGEARLQDVLTGFVDPNQPAEVLPAAAGRQPRMTTSPAMTIAKKPRNWARIRWRPTSA